MNITIKWHLFLTFKVFKLQIYSFSVENEDKNCNMSMFLLLYNMWEIKENWHLIHIQGKSILKLGDNLLNSNQSFLLINLANVALLQQCIESG